MTEIPHLPNYPITTDSEPLRNSEVWAKRVQKALRTPRLQWASQVLCGSVSAQSRLTSQPSQMPLRPWVGGKVTEFQPGSGFTGVLTFQKLIKQPQLVWLSG